MTIQENQLTVYQAIMERKQLKKRIEDIIFNYNMGESKFIAIAKDKAIAEQYDASIKSEYDKINSLLKRIDNINSAIVLSNANTKIVVGDREMTVAEAIIEKNSIKDKKEVLNSMVLQRNSAVKKYEDGLEKIRENAHDYVRDVTKNATEGVKIDYDKEFEKYVKNHEVFLVNPLKLDKKIEVLDKEINDFETNIDNALNVSNATTMITVN